MALHCGGALLDVGQEPVHDIGTNIPAATDRDGIAQAQQLGGAGNLTLNGAGVSGGSYAAGFDGGRKITIYSAGNLSARTFTVTGIDKDGAAQTEDITGPNNGTATGTKYFQTVTSIAADGAVGSDVEAGFAASLVVLNTNRARQFILAPANGETLVVAIYPNPTAGISTRVQLRLVVPASLTLTWADGTTPADTRIYWPDNNTAPTLQAGTSFFEFDADGSTISGDYAWYGMSADTVDNLIATLAPYDAQYLVLAANSTLTVERVLTAGAGIAFTDAGAGGALTVDVAITSTRIPFGDGSNKLTTDAAFTYVTGTGTLTVANITSSGVHLLGTGTVSAVSYGFSGDADTGMYRSSSGGRLLFAVDGACVLALFPTLARLQATGRLGWTDNANADAGTMDLVLTRDAANVYAWRNGANAQTGRIYGTFTDASNYERLSIALVAGTGATISMETAGTGGDNLGITFAGAGTGSIVFQTNATTALTINSSQQLLATAGTSSLPAYAFADNTDCGFILAGGNVIRAIVDATSVAFFSGSSFTLGVTTFDHGTTGRITRITKSDTTGWTLTHTTAATSGASTLMTVTTTANTGQTLSTEIPGVNFNLSATREWATGALALQREFRIQAPTYAFVGASTLTDAVTFAVDGPPIAGTNATLTRKWIATFGGFEATTSSATNGVYIGGAGTSGLIIRETGSNVEGFWLVSTTQGILGTATNHPLSIRTNNAEKLSLSGAGVLTFADAVDIAFNVTTGTKIGTAASEKFAFHNSTPVAQRAGADQAAVATTGATNTTPWGYTTEAQANAIVTLVNEIRAALVEKGLIKGAA